MSLKTFLDLADLQLFVQHTKIWSLFLLPDTTYCVWISPQGQYLWFRSQEHFSLYGFTSGEAPISFEEVLVSAPTENSRSFVVSLGVIRLMLSERVLEQLENSEVDPEVIERLIALSEISFLRNVSYNPIWFDFKPRSGRKHISLRSFLHETKFYYGTVARPEAQVPFEDLMSWLDEEEQLEFLFHLDLFR